MSVLMDMEAMFVSRMLLLGRLSKARLVLKLFKRNFEVWF